MEVDRGTGVLDPSEVKEVVEMPQQRKYTFFYTYTYDIAQPYKLVKTKQRSP
jgi:hypothetical protein